MTERDQTRDRDAEKVIERNVDRSREVIEARKKSENAGEARKPSVGATQYSEDTVPGGEDVPAGGTSGPNATGGSSKRRKTG